MPNTPGKRDPRRAEEQDFSTLSIPRITQQMVDEARQQAGQAAPQPDAGQVSATQWNLDRAAAQRLAASNPRRRGRRAPGVTSSFPAQRAPAANEAAGAPPAPRRAPEPQAPAAGDTTTSFRMPEAYRMPGPQAPAVGDTTASFRMPEAYRMPGPQAPAAGDTTTSFRMPEAYRMPGPQAPAAGAAPGAFKAPPARSTAAPAQASTFAQARARGSARPRPRPAPQPQEQPQAAPEGPDLTTAAAASEAMDAMSAPAKPAAGHAQPTRAQAEARLYQRIHDDHLWLNNPVMVRGLGLAPAIIAATDAHSALLLCAAAALLLTATRVLAVAMCHLLGHRQRPLLYVVCAAIVYIPAYSILYAALGADINLLGIYLPLLVTDPMVIKRMEAPELESPQEAFRRGLNNTLGVCAALLLLGILRELLGAGTLFGNPVFDYAMLPLASQPAGGFLLMGLMAAVWTSLGGHYVHYKQEEVRHLYAERKQ